MKLVELFFYIYVYSICLRYAPELKELFFKSNEFSQNNQYGNTLRRVPLGNLIYNIGRGFHAKYRTLSFVCLSVVSVLRREILNE